MGVVKSSPLVSTVTFPTLTAPIKSLLLHSTAVPWRNTLTIVLTLPGHQTLSYNPVVEDLAELLESLEDLLRRHRSKREIASVSAGSIGSLSQSSLIDAATPRHNHGHQHDHLHDQRHARGVDNSDHAAASVASGPFAGFSTDAGAAEDKQATAAVAGTNGAATLSDHLVDQSVGPDTDASPLADGENAPLVSATGEATIPGSLLADQYAASQPTLAYSGASPRSNTATNTDTTSISQQQFSAVERVTPSLWVVMCSLWMLSFTVIYH